MKNVLRSSAMTNRQFLVSPVKIETSIDFIEKVFDYSISMKQFEFISLFLRNLKTDFYDENILNFVKEKLKDYKNKIAFYDEFVFNAEKSIDDRNRPIQYGDRIVGVLKIETPQDFIKYFIGSSIHNKQFEFISLFLRNIPTDWFPSDILIYLLEQTAQIKKSVPFRMIFWFRTKGMIDRRNDADGSPIDLLR